MPNQPENLTDKLPTQTWCTIFSYFNRRELNNAGKVCKRFHHITQKPKLQENAYWPFDYSAPENKETLEIQVDEIDFYPKLRACVNKEGYAVYAANKNTLYIYNCQTGECKSIENENCFYRVGLAQHNRIITCSFDFISGLSFYIWDIVSGKLIRELPQVDSLSGTIVTKVLTAPNGNIITATEERTIIAWDINTGEKLKTFGNAHPGLVTDVIFLKNGDMASIEEENKIIKVWDYQTGECKKTLSGHTSDIACIEVDAKGNIVSGGKDGTIRVWDGTEGRVFDTVSSGWGSLKQAYSLSIFENKIACGDNSGRIFIYDLNTGKQECKIYASHNQDTIHTLYFLANGNLVSISSDEIKLWKFPEMKATEKLDEGNHLTMNTVVPTML